MKSLSLGVTVLFVIIVCLSAGPASAAMDFTWQQVMVGGGGGFTFTAISPYDSNFILLQGDMGSSYVSRDGATPPGVFCRRTWRAASISSASIPPITV